ncbi:AMP-binding protein [Streptomyces sp. Wh19]|uniref:AMP-binding protein n=1 Tax=Streptomyces sp. Wh19 TaxID=3076629 RepID=UPI0029587626|nr:AMP-binding protein [Streptomyces sp. Wh19]MDV9194466.1 AMP-binding protein [Streptomyces sp. Wh19]
MHEIALTWAGTLLHAAPGGLDRVGLFTTRGADTYLGLLAALYAGAAVVPLNPHFPTQRTLAMVDAARPSVFIVDDYGRPRLDDLGRLSRSARVPVLHGGQFGAADRQAPLHAPRTVVQRTPHTCSSPPAPPAGPRVFRSRMGMSITTWRR